MTRPTLRTVWDEHALTAARRHNAPIYHVESQWKEHDRILDLHEATELVEHANEQCECDYPYKVVRNNCRCGYRGVVFCTPPAAATSGVCECGAKCPHCPAPMLCDDCWSHPFTCTLCELARLI